MRSNPLWAHQKNVNSQHGEDGVLAEIFKVLGERTKWCVDVGAWDGQFLSNTCHLIVDQAWSGVMIEAHAGRGQSLRDRYRARPDVHCVLEPVSQQNGLDAILSRTPAPRVFDLLSVDIDGDDYWVWHDLSRYRPRVVVIEVNSTMPPAVVFVPKRAVPSRLPRWMADRLPPWLVNPNGDFGASFAAMVELAEAKGYKLVAHLGANCIFVEASEFDLLKLPALELHEQFTSPYVPLVIANPQGTHVVLRPGPWGFSRVMEGRPQRLQRFVHRLEIRLTEQQRTNKMFVESDKTASVYQYE